MSIDDEIREKKEKMVEDMRKTQMEKEAASRMKKALEKANLTPTAPEVIDPPSELQAIVEEVIPKFPSNNHLVSMFVCTMPDNRTLIRNSNYDTDKHKQIECSLFVPLFHDSSKIDPNIYYMFIFKNGKIAFSRHAIGDKVRSNATWEELNARGIDASVVREKIIEELARHAAEKETHKGGCYIATAVYGSYDCPEVWVLRRYRDFCLKKTAIGRLFVKVYYAVSPQLVKLFGDKHWFVASWKKFLDKKVSSLKDAGYSDTKYND